MNELNGHISYNGRAWGANSTKKQKWTQIWNQWTFIFNKLDIHFQFGVSQECLKVHLRMVSIIKCVDTQATKFHCSQNCVSHISCAGMLLSLFTINTLGLQSDGSRWPQGCSNIPFWGSQKVSSNLVLFWSPQHHNMVNGTPVSLDMKCGLEWDEWKPTLSGCFFRYICSIACIYSHKLQPISETADLPGFSPHNRSCVVPCWWEEWAA